MINLSRPMTYEDLQALPDDLYRHELIDGEHFMSPAPAIRHQRAVGKLYLLLANFVQAHGLGEVFVAPLDVFFSQHDVVEPDLLFVAAEHARQVEERYITGAPDLVIEVLSPSNRRMDKVRKLALYERQQVPEYWIVDPDNKVVEVYRLDTKTAPARSPQLTLRSTHRAAPAALADASHAEAASPVRHPGDPDDSGDELQPVETSLLPGLRIAPADIFAA